MKTLIKDYIYIIIRTIRLFFRSIELILPPKLACNLQNLLLLIVRSELRYKYDPKLRLYVAYEKNFFRYFGDLKRGFDFYGTSLIKRGNMLYNSYCLHNISFDKWDIVVDCGANYADLFIPLKDKIEEENYITFEPGPTEHKCIKKSVPNSRNFNLGLSNKEGLMNFYLCSATGDSSLIKPQKFTEIVDVKVTTLDNFMAQENIIKCKLLKLEAEGWEPEILMGANSFLKICEYVAIDGGRERGTKKELTFHVLNNHLTDIGFKMIDLNGHAYRALYKNTFI